jgi:hypothetical protein
VSGAVGTRSLFVLSEKGSDSSLIRVANNCGIFLEPIAKNQAARAVILVDYLHGGNQLKHAIEEIANRKRIESLEVYPFHTTRWSLKMFSEWCAKALKVGNPRLEVAINTTYSKVVENLDSNSPETPITELRLRLSELEYSSALVGKIEEECLRLGYELVAAYSDGTVEGATKLEHLKLGLVSFVEGSPSKSVLPVIRLGLSNLTEHGPLIQVAAKSPKFQDWHALLPHANSSGKG